MRQCLCVALLFATAVSSGQTRAARVATPQAEPTGTVSGHVFCSDTNEPARFAKVSLEAIVDPPPASKSATAAGTSSATDASTAKAPAAKSSGPSIPSSTVETTLDGSYTLSGVKPGSYYVVVEKLGYIKPRDMFTQKEIDDPSPQMRGIIAQALPRVRVEANQTERAEVRLERGGAISGRILYDDGSPAAELGVELLHKDETGKWVPPPTQDGISMHDALETDDTGHFRIPSLLPDEYMVKATLELADMKTTVMNGDGDNKMVFAMNSSRASLPFYGSGVARQKDAASVKLRAGQELTGEDMTIPLAKLHRLTGRVAAGRDAHFVNAADLSLVTREDGIEVTTATVSREDGLFHFEFVPEGDYILKVKNARDVVWETQKPEAGAMFNPMPQEKERVMQSYGNTEQTILLSGDMLGDVATVPPDAKPDVKAEAKQDGTTE